MWGCDDLAVEHPGPRPEHAERPDPRRGSDLGAIGDRDGDDGSFPDARVHEPAVGTDLGSGRHLGPPLEHHPRKEDRVGLELDRGVDVGALGIPHRHAAAHPPLVDPVPQLGLGDRELSPVVHARRLHRIREHDRGDGVPGVVQHPGHAGERVLAPRPDGMQPAQCRGEHPVPVTGDGCGDLVGLTHDLVGLAGELALVDHPDHLVVATADDPVVTGCIVTLAVSSVAAASSGPVMPDQSGEGRRPDKRRVPRQDDQVAFGVGERLGEHGERHGQGVAGPAVGGLLDEVDLRRRAVRSRSGSWSPNRRDGRRPRPPGRHGARRGRRARAGSSACRRCGGGASGRAECMRVPSPAASTTAESGRSTMTFSLSLDGWHESDDLCLVFEVLLVLGSITLMAPDGALCRF